MPHHEDMKQGPVGSRGERLHVVVTESAHEQSPEAIERELRQRQALEINDNIVQGLSVVKYSLDAGDLPRAREALEGTLKAARKIVTDLLNEDDVPYLHLGPGDLVRVEPATVVIAERE